ncbi:MAG: oligosaccharide flippase family protein [Candidatus Hydrogenedentes bacterium]|nr:oligosaccharide flippase family protein [Candidatus Hydrogenedentota bacterium]
MLETSVTRPPRIEISKRLVLVNSASSLVTRLLSISVLVWLQQYLLKRITPEEYSLLPVLYSVMMFAPLVTTILTGGLGRYIVEAYAKDDEERVTQIVSTMFPILCAVGLVFLACGWTFAWYIGSVLNIAPERIWDARVMMALLMFSAAIRLPLSPFSLGLFIRQKFVLQNVIAVGTELFRLLLLFGLLFGVSTRIMWVIMASVCAEMLNLAITLDVSRRVVPNVRFRCSRIHWPIARELTSFGGWSFVWNLADTIRTSADVLILNKLASPLDVTCFSLGSIPLRHMQQASYAIRGPLAPVLTALYAKGDTKRLARIYLRGGRYALWVSLFLCLPLMVYSRELIILYVGEKYLAAAPVITLLLALFPIMYGSVMLPEFSQATSRIRPAAARQVAMNALNLLLTLYFVGPRQMGALGSALGTTLGLLVLFPWLMWPLGLKMAGVSWRRWLRETVWPGLAPGCTAAVVWLVLRVLVQPSSWWTLFACVLGGGMAYLVVLLLSCLHGEDRVDLHRFWSTFTAILRPAGLVRKSPAVYAESVSRE